MKKVLAALFILGISGGAYAAQEGMKDDMSGKEPAAMEKSMDTTKPADAQGAAEKGGQSEMGKEGMKDSGVKSGAADSSKDLM